MINIPNQIYMLEKYGYNEQERLAMEECSELIQAINKAHRAEAKGEAIHHLTEEIADVLIMIEQLKLIYEIDDGDIQRWVNYKQERQFKRMNQYAGEYADMPTFQSAT